MAYKFLTPPTEGDTIQLQAGGLLVVPDRPIIPQIIGDGIGRDISRAMVRVIDAAVRLSYGDKRRIVWFVVPAGGEAFKKHGEWLPEDTLEAIHTHRLAIKGPLTTPIGGGIRSLNVALRQIFDLYACVRPCRWFDGVPTPVQHPEKLRVVIFRENTEDVYSGVEYPKGSPEAEKLIHFLKEELGREIKPDSGMGIKHISETSSKRLVRLAIKHAVEHQLPSVTLVHKGNIMKYTEGAFRDWGYEVARDEFRDQVVLESELEGLGGKAPEGKVVIKDRIADSMFQQVLLRPEEYSILASTNLNGDYLSDACAAQIGGLGMAPGANFGDGIAIFEATHGTAPKYADKDMVNPCSLILSAVMMLTHMGWMEAAQLVVKGITFAICAKTVTYDLARQIEGATELSTSAFGEAVVSHMAE